MLSYEQPKRGVVLDLLPLVPSTTPRHSTLRLGFFGSVLTSYAINLNLSADGVRASPEHLSYLAYAVSFTF